MAAYPFGFNIKSFGNITHVSNPLSHEPNHPFSNLQVVKNRLNKGKKHKTTSIKHFDFKEIRNETVCFLKNFC